jgi:GH43 family beta-xylosidase
MLKRDEIRIRDPFILKEKEEGCYYMYGTTSLEEDSIAAGASFTVYRSRDLESFEDGRVIFDSARCSFPCDRDFWAPEVHKYRGKYYLFGSCKGEKSNRGTYLFVCDTPDGDFVPVSNEPLTPKEWECLDGTLYVEGDTPYIVFCHEWLQCKNGEIWAMELSDDLKTGVGEPFMLFRATDNPFVSPLGDSEDNYVTDGPFLYEEGGKLHILWSSFYLGRYMIIGAESDGIRGEWVHGSPLFDFDGGHAMLFRTLSGERMISLHSPNYAGFERAVFYPFPEKK